MKLENNSRQSDLIQSVERLKTSLLYWQQLDRNVANYRSAEELKQLFNVKLGEEGCEDAELTEAIEQYLRHTPDVGSPEFNKQLYSGVDEVAVLGEWLSTVTNSNMHTYQVSPVATLMELEIVKQLTQLIGFPQGDGIMVSGGSMANMVGMMLARHKVSVDVKQDGLFAQKPLVAYVSELAHYSYKKAANLLGIGTNNLIAVETDDDGQMNVEALALAVEKTLADHKQPFFIGLTAGTTVVGSFDPIIAINNVAKQYGLWLHIDGAWGGPALFSSKIKYYFEGSECADSFTWDAHKLMNMPITTSLILVKDRAMLTDCCSGGGGEYLFHADENSETSLGDKSLQCGRQADAVKLWLSWKAKGSKQFQVRIDTLLAVKDKMLELIEHQPRLQLLAPAPYLNVLFQYVPKVAISHQALADLNIAICKKMLSDDIRFVDYSNYKGELGIRFILANEALSENNISRFLDNCIEIGDSMCGA